MENKFHELIEKYGEDSPQSIFYTELNNHNFETFGVNILKEAQIKRFNSKSLVIDLVTTHNTPTKGSLNISSWALTAVQQQGIKTLIVMGSVDMRALIMKNLKRKTGFDKIGDKQTIPVMFLKDGKATDTHSSTDQRVNIRFKRGEFFIVDETGKMHHMNSKFDMLKFWAEDPAHENFRAAMEQNRMEEYM